ncbi:MAG: metal ABC transporter permease [Oscillospiraceae bacterium]|nr:metal ABC transporter permease [Oscillospiraceae bacterium]
MTPLLEVLSDLPATISFMFSFTFMVRAIVVGLFVSLCAALLGVSLVLKRYAMIGTGLSNVGFAAMVIAGVIDVAPLAFSMPVVIATAFILLRMNESSKVKGDSAVALIATSGLAIGVIVMAMTTGITLHICNIMFGSIFAMTQADMYMSIALCAVVIIIFVLFYKQLFAVTYDESFAKATGTKVEVYKSMLAILTAVTVVLGMRMMGALLIASLTLFPALSAMRLCKRFLSVVVASAAIGIACFFVGMIFSFALDLPPGASVVGINLIVFAIFSCVSFVRQKL